MSWPPQSASVQLGAPSEREGVTLLGGKELIFGMLRASGHDGSATDGDDYNYNYYNNNNNNNN